MGEHPGSSDTSRKAGGQTLMQAAERLLGFSALATLVVYLLGVLIVATYLSKYDVPISSLGRWRYLAAGTSLVVYLGLGAMPTALLSHAVLDWLHARLAVGRLRYGLFLVLAYGVGVGGIQLCCAVRALPEYVEPGKYDWSRFTLFLLGMGVALGALLTYARRRVAVEPTPFRLWWLAVLVFAVVWVCASQYGALYYEHIPRELGGGEPSPVAVIVDEAGAAALAEAILPQKKGSQPLLAAMAVGTTARIYVEPNAVLIDEDANTYYVRIAKAREDVERAHFDRLYAEIDALLAVEPKSDDDRARLATLFSELHEAYPAVDFERWTLSNCVRLSKAHVHGMAFVAIAEKADRSWLRRF